MKSKVNLAVMVLGLSLVTATQADVAPQHTMTMVPPAALSSFAIIHDVESKMEGAQQANQFAIIQPCYRWPHPCD